MATEVDEKVAQQANDATVQDNGILDPKRHGSVDDGDVEVLGYKPELQRNRSMFTLLFQSLAIAAIPYGEGGPLISAIYGGGQLSIFLGWIGENSTGTACCKSSPLILYSDPDPG